MADFLVENHGTIFLLEPTTDAACEWVEEHLSAEPTRPTRWGSAIVVEHRYIREIVEGARRDGLVVVV